jgi:hypothetical protein
MSKMKTMAEGLKGVIHMEEMRTLVRHIQIGKQKGDKS